MPAPRKTPHGKRVSDAEKELRMEFFADHMSDGKSRSEILEEVRIKYPQMKPRTITDYFSRVRQRWAREAEAERPTERAATIQRLRRRCNDLWQRKDCGHAIQLERLLVDIVGLKAPHPLDTTPQDGTRLDWRDIAAAATDEELVLLQRITSRASALKKAAGGGAETELPDDLEEDPSDREQEDAEAPEVPEVPAPPASEPVAAPEEPATASAPQPDPAPASQPTTPPVPVEETQERSESSPTPDVREFEEGRRHASDDDERD